MKQLPAAAVPARTPLDHVGLAAIAEHAPAAGGVRFRELGLRGHLTLRCNPNNPELLGQVERVLGMALPVKALTSIEDGERVIRWISPDEWLITLPNPSAHALEQRFADEVEGHYSLVNGSGGLTVFQLSGDNVVDMLKKSVSVDLHPSQFPVGKVVSTVFAKASAVLRRSGENTFEVVVRRSFADYLWLWIQSASQEFGLVVEV